MVGGSSYFEITKEEGGKFDVSGNIMYLADKEGKTTAIGDHAFSGLFCKSVGLESAKDLLLPDVVSEYCYFHMFYFCENLTAAPELPATTLASDCYHDMFFSCTNLSSVTVGFTAWGDGDDATSYWLTGVSGSGTFTCPSGLNTDTRDDSHVSSGWNIVRQ